MSIQHNINKLANDAGTGADVVWGLLDVYLNGTHDCLDGDMLRLYDTYFVRISTMGDTIATYGDE